MVTRRSIPGSGNDSASAATASRSATDNRRQGCTVSSAARAPPRPGDLACHEEGTGPDARCPERIAAVGVRDQEVAIGSLEEEVGVAARRMLPLNTH